MASVKDSWTNVVPARISKKQVIGGTPDIHILEPCYSKVPRNELEVGSMGTERVDSDKKVAFQTCKQHLAKKVLSHAADKSDQQTLN